MKKICYKDFIQEIIQMKDLYIKFHNLKQIKDFKTLEKEKLNNELKVLILLEDQAISKNDFEEAEIIENKIVEIRTNLEKLESDRENFYSEMINLREEELKMYKNSEKILVDTSKKLSQLKLHLEKEIESFNNNELVKHKNEGITIKNLVEKLQFLKSDIEENKAYIDEEEEKINQVIKSQSIDIFNDLEALTSNKNEVLDEIYNLEKLLEQKYLELNKMDKQIEIKEVEIEAIKSTYSHEFNKISQKKVLYKDKLKDYNDKKLNCEDMKYSYEQNQIVLDKKLTEMNTFIANIDKEITDMQNEMLNIDKKFIKKTNLLNKEIEINFKIKNIEGYINSLSQKKTDELNEINNLEVAIKKLETEIASCDIKIPSLEEEKRCFVNAKNFKEAAKISNELKTLNELKVKNLELLTSYKQSVIKLKDEINFIDNDLKQKQQEKCETIIEINITNYEFLLCFRKQLKGFIEEYQCKAEFAENDISVNEDTALLNEEVSLNIFILATICLRRNQ